MPARPEVVGAPVNEGLFSGAAPATCSTATGVWSGVMAPAGMVVPFAATVRVALLAATAAVEHPTLVMIPPFVVHKGRVEAPRPGTATLAKLAAPEPLIDAGHV